MSLGSIVVKLQMQTADFETDAGRAAKVAQKRAREIDQAFTKAGKAIGIALGAAFVGGAALMGKYVRNTIEAEKVQAQLASRIKDTGGAAQRTLGELNEQAEKLSRLTVFDDEAVGGVQAMLLTFKNLQGVNFDQATKAVLNLSTAMGTDLNGAALQVGKALNDPIGGISALSRAGVQFSDDQKKAIKAMVDMGDTAGAQTVILKELEGQMGTAAEAARNTLGGALTGLSNDFSNLLEGDSGSDGVRGTVEAINAFAETLNDPSIKAGIDSMATGLLVIANNAIKATAWLGNATSALLEYYGADAKKSMQSLINERNQIEYTDLPKAEKRKKNAPIMAKWLGIDDAGVTELNARLKVVDGLLDDAYRKAASKDPSGRFSPAYEAASLNFNPNGRASSGGGKASSGKAGGRARAAAAMPDFAKDDLDALRRLVEQTTAANEQFDRMAATLSGPLAQAQYEHEQALARITELGTTAGRSSEEVAALKTMETDQYNVQRMAIEQSLNPMQELLDAQMAELQMIGMGNAERTMANVLRAKGIDLASAEAQSYLRSAVAMGEFYDAAEASRNAQIEGMDILRNNMGDLFTDLRHGEDAWDSLRSAAAGFFDDIAAAIQKQLLKQLFGQMGSAQTGSSGGFWASIIGAFLGSAGGGGAAASTAGGSWGGLNWATGGYTGAGGVNEIAGNVHKGEVVWSQADVARAGGVGAVESARMGGGGTGSGSRKPQRIVLVDNQKDGEAMLRSSTGEDAIMVHIGNNAGAIRELLA